MSRVKRGIFSKKKHKKILRLCKGYIGRRKNVYRISKQAYIKSLQYFYRDTRNKKRYLRKKWIKYINYKLSLLKDKIKYNKFINILKKKKILINRKSLYEICLKNKLENFLNIVYENYKIKT
ncbi:50S ribosomal protein L20 [Candidatus Vidania fulgoroideorum]